MIKLAEEQNLELTSSHKYMQNTSRRATLLPERLPNVAEGLRLLTRQGKPRSWAGQMKERERERDWDGICAPRSELWEKKASATWKCPHWRDRGGLGLRGKRNNQFAEGKMDSHGPERPCLRCPMQMGAAC